MLDEFDREILRLVQEDNQLTHAEIGRRVNLSASSVRRRLARLRSEGVIEADVSIVAVDRRQLTAIVQVFFEKETLASDEQFRRAMRASPEVSQCYAVSGDTDFILVVHADSPADYEAWGHRTLMTNPHIRRYDTHIVWSRVKHSTRVPV